MKPFEFVNAESATHAISLLEADPSQTRLIAGGTDIMGEIKESVVEPATLVNISAINDISGITIAENGLRLGALTTLNEIESDETIAREYPALAQAAASVATPQIRNVGTLGGNLCQRPRCWYYRSPLFDCRKKGGAICFAINGNNKYHAILGGVDCYIVHPSDLAVALISLKAEATLVGSNGDRTLPLKEFFVGPERDIMAETVLQPGEFLSMVYVPKVEVGHKSIYLKARERQTQDFALVSVAVAIEVANGNVQDVRITLGGVAPTPCRARHAEDAVKGKAVEGVDAGAVGELSVREAQPLRDNHFKVRLAASLVSRALRTLLESETPHKSSTPLELQGEQP